jgi:hypothetical protein
MTGNATCLLDDLRVKHPDLGFALYAMEPGQPVTLEVFTPDSEVFSWTEPTAAAALARAFPEDEAPTDIPPDPPARADDIFS